MHSPQWHLDSGFMGFDFCFLFYDAESSISCIPGKHRAIELHAQLDAPAVSLQQAQPLCDLSRHPGPQGHSESGEGSVSSGGLRGCGAHFAGPGPPSAEALCDTCERLEWGHNRPGCIGRLGSQPRLQPFHSLCQGLLILCRQNCISTINLEESRKGEVCVSVIYSVVPRKDSLRCGL